MRKRLHGAECRALGYLDMERVTLCLLFPDFLLLSILRQTFADSKTRDKPEFKQLPSNVSKMIAKDDPTYLENLSRKIFETITESMPAILEKSRGVSGFLRTPWPLHGEIFGSFRRVN